MKIKYKRMYPSQNLNIFIRKKQNLLYLEYALNKKKKVGEIISVFGFKSKIYSDKKLRKTPVFIQIDDFFSKLKNEDPLWFQALNGLKIGFIANIEVQPDFRRKSIGTTMIEHFTSFSTKKKCDILIALTISNDNVASNFWNHQHHYNQWEKSPYLLGCLRVFHKSLQIGKK